MKLAITGKGGVGKTTLTSLLAYHYVSHGGTVLAIDADPSPCLGAALGFSPEALKGLKPISEMEELIYERTGAQPGTTGGYFKINPRVDDIPDRFAVSYRGIKLLELGAVETGGSGCICPESVMLKQLVSHILLRRGEVVLLDMYAGVEHLGRATVDFVDAMIIVVEPTRRSLGTAAQIKKLAEDIGVRRFLLVGNKVGDESEIAFLKAETPGIPLLGTLPADPAVLEADRLGAAVYDHIPAFRQAAREMSQKLEKWIEES
jgi:CO dehydrogenase maturation factor